MRQPLLLIFLIQVKKKIAPEERFQVIMGEVIGTIVVVVEAEEGIQLVTVPPVNYVGSMITLL